jgi:uncharacterized protein (DUF1800 family)
MRRYATAAVSAVLVTVLAVPSAAPLPSDDAAIVHVLNRIGFGPRPGDVAKVRELGLQRYIDQQLRPEWLADADLQARLAPFATLSLSSAELSARYQRPAADATRAERQAANLPFIEMSQQRVLRAIYSERQLEEVLTDFWFNHFNVDSRKGPVRFLLSAYERDAIRPHVLGKFRDLLGATAKSPAMLFYLDNWMSADPNAATKWADPQRPQRPQRPPRLEMAAQPNAVRRGLNENYARELMELHTLGVDGGHTQKDVTEVARAFTGWTIVNPRQGGDFRFEPRMHDAGDKTVLGRRINAGGMKDGEQVLDLLAAHPSTARFISTKLARRFVSDTPPPALVDRLAARFTATSGDLREVMRALLASPEFLSPSAYSAKVKTPFEFVVSALRATRADVADARPVVRSLQQLGMPLYQCQPPTGYKDTADAWVNTGALINRMNVATTLATGQLTRAGHHAHVLIGLAVSDATRATIQKSASPQQALALTLGSPEFQRR